METDADSLPLGRAGFLARVEYNRLRLLAIVSGLSIMARFLFFWVDHHPAGDKTDMRVAPNGICLAIILRILVPAEQAARCLIFVSARLLGGTPPSDAARDLYIAFGVHSHAASADMHPAALLARIDALKAALDDLPRQGRWLKRIWKRSRAGLDGDLSLSATQMPPRMAHLTKNVTALIASPSCLMSFARHAPSRRIAAQCLAPP